MARPDNDETLNGRVMATLDKAKMGKTQATARALLDKLTDAEIGRLTARTQLEILGHLHLPDTQRLPARDIMDAQSKLYRNMKLDPEFQAQEEDRIKDVATAIVAEPSIADARKKWGSLDEAERIKVMEKVVKIHSDKMGLTPASITPFLEEPEEEPNPDGGDPLLFIRHASYDFATDTIEVNTHKYAALSNFNEALLTILHENNHNHQLQLISRLRNGQIDKSDKDYVQIALFSLNYTRSGMVPSSGEDYQAYLRQPVEDHAEWAAKQITAQVHHRLQPKPPPGPSANDVDPDPPKADRRGPATPGFSI
ncbi:MAG: hypothetical protein Alpg2KO_22030 [Alphaproteobacteria bacterium]